MLTALTSFIPLCALVCGVGDVLPANQTVELQYSGQLRRVNQEGDSAAKTFSLVSVLSPVQDGKRTWTCVWEERGGGAWPWSSRILRQQIQPDGQLVTPPAAEGDLKEIRPQTLSLLHTHEGVPTPVSVIAPLLWLPNVAADASWIRGRERWTAVKKETRKERECWRLEGATNFGRTRTIWLAVDAPVVIESEERLFMGQGQEYQLRYELQLLKPVPEADVEKWRSLTDQLVELQTKLNRPLDETRPELSTEQLQVVSEALPALQQKSLGTPFAEFVRGIGRDSRSQKDRNGELEIVIAKLVGQKSPELKYTPITAESPAPESLAGKILVLHFWEYQPEPLIEPYGQVGYLDFLYNARRKLGVEVLGVAVDRRFAEAESARDASRSVQKLRAAMNLSYPLVGDDGSLAAAFGDPRKVGGKLPLWIVVGADGVITHYHAGLHAVDSEAGLKMLDAAVIKAIQEKKAAEK